MSTSLCGKFYQTNPRDEYLTSRRAFLPPPARTWIGPDYFHSFFNLIVEFFKKDDWIKLYQLRRILTCIWTKNAKIIERAEFFQTKGTHFVKLICQPKDGTSFPHLWGRLRVCCLKLLRLANVNKCVGLSSGSVRICHSMDLESQVVSCWHWSGVLNNTGQTAFREGDVEPIR